MNDEIWINEYAQYDSEKNGTSCYFSKERADQGADKTTRLSCRRFIRVEEGKAYIRGKWMTADEIADCWENDTSYATVRLWLKSHIEGKVDQPKQGKSMPEISCESCDCKKTKKPSNKERVWPCEHIQRDGTSWMRLATPSSNQYVGVEYTFNFCPFCGARRPDPEPAKVDWGKVKAGTKIEVKQNSLVYVAEFIAFNNGKLIVRCHGQVCEWNPDDCQLAEVEK